MADNNTEAEKDASVTMMPDMGAMTGSPVKKKITVPVWIIPIVAFVCMIPYYPLYQSGYKKGYSMIFKPGIGEMRKSNEYSRPLFPLMNNVINLRDPEIPKYLELSIQLAAREDAELSEFAVREGQIRDVVISLISKFRARDLDTVMEQRKLKRLLKDELNATLVKARVAEVYFTHFQIKILKKEKFISEGN